MTIQQFIEKAIEGGYDGEKVRMFGAAEWRYLVLLEPAAWEAVGRVAGWPMLHLDHEGNGGECWCKPEITHEEDADIVVHQDHTPEGHMHSMVDALCEGKTIEQYLETL